MEEFKIEKKDGIKFIGGYRLETKLLQMYENSSYQDIEQYIRKRLFTFVSEETIKEIIPIAKLFYQEQLRKKYEQRLYKADKKLRNKEKFIERLKRKMEKNK